MKVILFMFLLAFNFAHADERVELTVKHFNETYTNVDSLLRHLKTQDQAQAQAFEDHLKMQGIKFDSKLPELALVNKEVRIKGYNGDDFKMTFTTNNGVDFHYMGKTATFNITTPISEIREFFKTETKTSFIDLVISKAHANDLGSTAALAVGSFGVDLTSVAYGTTSSYNYGSDMTIKEKIQSYFQKRTRESAKEMCQEVQEGKKVKGKDIEKMTKRLTDAKKEIRCIQYWPATSTASCAWYDEKIACVTQTPQDKVNDTSRGATKEKAPTQDSSKTESTKNTLAK